MPAKRENSQRKPDSSKSASGKPKVEWKGYVNVELNTEDKKGISEVKDMALLVDTVINDLVEHGYSFKVRYDAYNKCFAAQFYCEDSSDPNAGWCLSMRGGNWWTATCRLCYVQSVMLQSRWNVQDTKGWDDSQW